VTIGIEQLNQTILRATNLEIKAYNDPFRLLILYLHNPEPPIGLASEKERDFIIFGSRGNGKRDEGV
jgi:hypothetical protein